MRLWIGLAFLGIVFGQPAVAQTQAVEITNTNGSCSCFDDPDIDECKEWSLSKSTCKDVDKCCEDADGNKVCCVSTAAVAGPGGSLCSGGEIIFHRDQAVGCLFKRFGPEERSQCGEKAVIQPVRRIGTCWVCVEEGSRSLVLQQASWSELRLSDQEANSREASFSCLGRLHVEVGTRIETLPARPLPHRPDPGVEVDPEARCRGTWTPWLDRDTPGGSGDYETLKDHLQAGHGCRQPSAIECRTKGGVPSSKTGEVVHCAPAVGGYCVNQEQPKGKRCSDYEVRFCC